LSAAASVPVNPSTASDKVNILLVDDQPAKLLAYEAMLEDLGENLIKASSAREALDQLLKNDITIVLMDVSMPEIDGFELAAMIRQHPRYQKTAIIFVSAVHLTDLDRLRGYESGAVDYVSVPVIPELLRAKVSVFAELYRKTSEFERLNRELEQRVAERTAALQEAVDKQKELADKLRAADRRKDEFLALLAHELRNPLAPIRNAVGIMRRKGTDDPQLAWCHDVIERQSNQLNRLVDDLLDVSRITRGKIQLRRETVDLATVVAGAIETSSPLIHEHGHTLRVSTAPGSMLVNGDASRLTQVVANLLNNAAKYQNDGGTIALTLRAENGEAVITVADGGIGLTHEMLSEAFELFSQGERTPDRAQGGLGIGLSLVKQLVEMHGGRVCARSEGPGRGSEFELRLPCLDPAHCNGNDPASEPTVSGDEHGRRVLVVDDNVDAADSLAILLRLDGHHVALAYDGPQAIELAQAERPNVILLDIGLPGMDGYEVCRRLRESGFDGARVIAMTGYGQDKDRQRAIEAGFDEHTVKPVALAALKRLLAAS
jgi:signal transduction histidine kinase